MNKKEAEELARSGITLGQVKQTLLNARSAGANNEKVATVNRGMTKSTAWNIFWKGWTWDTEPDEKVVNKHITGEWYPVRNVLCEFGDYFPGYESQPKKIRGRGNTEPYHQEPIQIEDIPF